MADVFKHPPVSKDLKEVRFIKILPGAKSSSVCCESHVRSLDKGLEYQALSYAWGSSANTAKIELNGQPFLVSENLLAALKFLRNESEPRNLWIDALSINQEDHIEKAWQVGLMGTIYRQCNEVIVWLGEEIEHSDCQVIEDQRHNLPIKQYRGKYSQGKRFFCDGYPRGRCQSFCGHKDFSGQRPVNFSAVVDLLSSLKGNKHLRDITTFKIGFWKPGRSYRKATEPLIALAALMNRSWWKRVWTVQEAALAPTLTLCWGRMQYSFEDMAQSAQNLYCHSKTCCSTFFTKFIQKLEDTSCGGMTINSLFNFQKHVHSLELLRRKAKSRDVDINLMDCLYDFHGRESKNPRDRIFGFLGLVPKLDISVDYDIDEKQLYEEVTVHLLQYSRDRPLSTLWRESEPTNSHPAWVKNFHETAAFNRRARSQHYSASNKNNFELRKYDGGIIEVRGTKVDSVSKVNPHSHAASTYSLKQFSTLSDWANFLKCIFYNDKTYVYGGNLSTAFARTLVGDIHALKKYPGFSEEKLEQFVQLLFQAKLENSLVDATLVQQINTSAADRKLFVTEQRLIGLGPKWMRHDDEVWVIHGGSVPFILRPKPQSGLTKYHQVIGDCYVQGIMFGEAVENPTNTQFISLI